MFGSHAIYAGLIKNNVKDVFIYSGGSIMSLIDLFTKKNKKINYYVNNHEQNVGHAATGYAKSSNNTGVCIVTSGPGLTNMVTPMLDAQNDSTPLVVFSGQVSLESKGKLSFQECDATSITKSCTKWSYDVQKNDDLFELTNEAIRVANHGKKGCVHIDIPKCILNDFNGNNIVKFNSYDEITIEDDIKIKNDKIDYTKLDKIISQASQPVIIIGKGCNDFSDDLYKFIKKYKIHTTSTIHSMGTFDETDDLSLGFLGMHGFPVANFAVQNSDLIIALGSRFDDRITGKLSLFAPKCKNIIHVNIENSELGRIVDTTNERFVYKLNISCDIFFKNINIIKSSQINNKKCWNNDINTWKKSYPITYNIPKFNKLNTQMVIEQIGKSINKSNTIITTGVGNHQMMTGQFIDFRKPKQFITSGSLGVMGTGLPYAIGCQIANPTKTVIDIDGDGSFNHTLADLQTVYKYNLPIKIFIMNDGHMSMVRAWEKLFYNENYVATDCSDNPDYCKLAESYGIKSVYLSSKYSLETIVNYVINYNDGPILCNCVVESDLCLPLVAPGKALDDMMLLNNDNNNYIYNCESPS